MKFTFTPDHIVLNDLFARDIRYVIPNYQRPYSWECIGKSERNNQINIMWDDLFSFFESGEKGEYFFGSMVLIDKDEREFQVIDGQQRLTSSIILFVSIKCFLLSLTDENLSPLNYEGLKEFISNSINAIDDVVYNKSTLGGLNPEKKVKIEKNAEYDYDEILSKALNCDEFNSEGLTVEQARIGKRYFDNRKYFVEQLQKAFLTENTFDDNNAQRLEKFTKFLQNRVSIVRIKTPDFDSAYQIFEVLNNRGLPLSNKDLFRNFVIKEFSELKKIDEDLYTDLSPVSKWNYLEDNYSLTSDFIGRWIESRKAGQQKYSAFNDLKEYYKKNYDDDLNKKKIENLYSDIKEDLNSYSIIVGDDFSNKEIKYKVKFLIQTGNLRYTLNLLISLFRNRNYTGGENEDVFAFITIYEKYVLNILLSSSKRFSNAPIYDAIGMLNNGNYEGAKNVFLLNDEESLFLKELIQGDIKDNYIAKLLIAKFIWYSECNIDDVVEQNLHFDKATLEHVIPQNPEENTNWMNNFTQDFKNEYTYKLGNMTLLTKRMNSAAKNYDFNIKKQKYVKTLLPITQEIATKEALNTVFFTERQNRIITGIITDLQL